MQSEDNTAADTIVGTVTAVVDDVVVDDVVVDDAVVDDAVADTCVLHTAEPMGVTAETSGSEADAAVESGTAGETVIGSGTAAAAEPGTAAAAEPGTAAAAAAEMVELKAKPNEHYYVVSYSGGLVAVYYSESAVRENVLKRFSLTPFVVQRFRVAEGPPVDVVWVVLFSGNDAVAFVSNSRDEAEQVRAGYARIGLAYEDSIDYWERKVGVISEPTLEFLTSTDRAHQMYAGPAVAEEREQQEKEEIVRLDRLLAPVSGGIVETILRNNERVSLFDGIIDILSSDENDLDLPDLEEQSEPAMKRSESAMEQSEPLNKAAPLDQLVKNE